MIPSIACNIQGRPVPNRYEKRGTSFVYLSRAGIATVNGITEFVPSDPPRKYLYSFGNHIVWYREIDPPGTPWHFVTANNYNQRSAATGGLVQSLAYTQIRNGASGGAVIDSLENYVPTATEFQSPYSPIWTQERLRRYQDSINLNPGEITPRYGLGALNLNGLSLPANGNFVIYPVWSTDRWAITIEGFCSNTSAVGTLDYHFYLNIAPNNSEPNDIAAGQLEIFLGNVVPPNNNVVPYSFTLSLPPGVSLKFGCAVYSLGPAQYASNPIDYGTPQRDAGVNPWFYLPENPADLSLSYSENLASEDHYYTALGRGVYTPGSLTKAVTNSLSGGLSAFSFASIVMDGVAIELQATLGGLVVGNRYQFDVTFRDNTIGLTDYTYTTVSEIFTATSATLVRSIYMQAPDGKERIKFSDSRTDLGPEPTPSTPNYQPETLIYWGRILGNGGTITETDLDIADSFVIAWKASGIGGKLRYLLPYLGDDWLAGQVPLIDKGGWGLPVMSGPTPFNDSDFSRSTGLQGRADAFIRFPFTPQGGSSGNNFGMGQWILDNDFSLGGLGVGTYWNSGNNHIYGLRSDVPYVRFQYTNVASPTESVQYSWPGTAPTQLHLYGQRLSQTDRRLYVDGAIVGTNVVSDANLANGNQYGMPILGDTLSGGERYGTNRLGATYWTNGGLTDPEVSDLHSLISTYLITPSGK